MKRTAILQSAIAMLACIGVALPQAAGAAERQASTTASAPLMQDVGLLPGGVLSGQVVGENSKAQADTPVYLVRQSEIVAQTRTDASGRFQMEDVQAGVYQLGTPTNAQVYRVWAPGTAPPVARDHVLLVHQNGLVRGQSPNYPMLRWLGNPWVLGGVAAAAITIPLALDDDDPSGS